ncbi:hypothetical protein EVAR_69788_1 [Eumeta japonica]|uniref:Uncharacterized protein n=1 Tax=Eumeta variegata TaxID=151549 RepID=A0A4C2A666_EUMVA|nr:hypothetical protein EVAR_69788_1 [Eumeta japonica]
MEPDESDNGASKLPAPFSDPESQYRSKSILRQYQQAQTWLNCVVSLWSTNVYLPGLSSDSGNQYGQRAFQDNSNNREYRSHTLFYYRVLVPTFQLHHQTLKVTHGESTSQDNSNKLKHD